MTRSMIIFWWLAFVLTGVVIAMAYEWLTSELPAYKTGGNEDGWKPRRGSNMRDDQQGSTK